MANICSVGIRIDLAADKDCEKLYERFVRDYKKASEEKKGMFIGCENRYLFDVQTFRDRDTLQISGWVKWGFRNEEVAAFILWLKEQAEIRDFHMNYEESGCLLYDEYNYDGKTLTNSYLPEGLFPDDDDTENFYIEMESRFRKHHKTVEISLTK